MRKLLFLGATLMSCASTQNPNTETPDAASFVAEQVAIVKPLIIEANRTWFTAAVTGTDETFEKSKQAEIALKKYFADPDRFAQIKALRETKIEDSRVKRQIDLLYLNMLGNQVPPELLIKTTALEKEVEQLFNTYRGKVGEREVTQNEIGEILRSSTDSKELEAAWSAQKDVGKLVAPKLLELVQLRNQVAKSLGFRDYYALRVVESEQDETKLLALFDELDELTREPFLKHKAEVDKRLAARLKIKPSALMPWHYQNPFFQEPPDIFDTGLDAIYKKQDTLQLCRDFYSGIDLPADDIIERSDLYEKKGKSPHAFAADIDREGDIRVLANIVPGLDWQTTMVHELGHALYDKYFDPSLPWLLKKSSHAVITEGVAMMLDRLVPNPHWAEGMGLIDAKKREAILPEARAHLAFASLQFSRWTQVMLRFERELYRNPKQDLAALWWDLVAKYQGLKKPEGRTAPDYASKIHLVIVPVYYHNYMMGELFSAQTHEAIAALQKKGPLETIYVGDKKTGQFMKEQIFHHGALYRWDELTEKATGKPLSAEAFARRFQ